MVTGGRGTATRTVGLLGGIFTYAVSAKIIGVNPVRGVKRFPDKKNVRFLSSEEIGRLGKALAAVEAAGANPNGILVIRLLLLTGARRGEIETVKISEVDVTTRTLRLSDSKTGQKVLLLNTAALSVVREALTLGPASRQYLFENKGGTGAFSGTPKIWAKVCAAGGFSQLRMHDLRHSFASLGVLNGAPLSIVGSLLGHADAATTQRYAHLSEDPIRAATEMIGTAISQALGQQAVLE